MKALNDVLMVLLSLIVLGSLVGVSVKQVGEKHSYSFFIKTEPSLKMFFLLAPQ
ncbi:hypothetical protein [Pelistega suis]|uniref:Uncharacterized protein n=1 Tax=Pelistega suis TaxID=1631957 RepID=A0A849P3L2_9BURK|nr:hypothetical protein [Pelistega suis]MCQ9329658.1 hypothetical protein [Pelistega suis]NOL52090.1 hypothetical protein [Pelistega suis]